MKLYRVIQLHNCFFAIAAKPNSDKLLSELTRLKKEGVEELLSLIEPHEAAWLDLSSEEQAAAIVGLQFTHCPMPDREPPRDLGRLLALTERVIHNLDSGSSSVIHCVGGIGRSGLVALAVLINRGFEVGEAIEHVAAVRGRKAPDTASQLLWFEENASLLKIAK
ncbi:MAG: tyrosine protein phosphatase [Pseudomonadota bacterium]